MLKSIVILIIFSLCIGLAAWLVFVWAVKSGEFDDSEGPKYRMLEDEEDNQTNIESKPRRGTHEK